ncbi:hypothetical protein ACJX0J_034767, partial [Zea mays]
VSWIFVGTFECIEIDLVFNKDVFFFGYKSPVSHQYHVCFLNYSGSLFGGFASLEERDNISFAVANLLCQSTVVASAIFGNYNFGFQKYQQIFERYSLLLYWEGSNSTVNAGDFAPTQLSEIMFHKTGFQES